MPRRNELLERLMTELALTGEPAVAILIRLGTPRGKADRLLRSAAYRSAAQRLNTRLTVCRETDLARAASVAATNVLRAVLDSAERLDVSADAQALSATAVRLAQAGERLALNAARVSTKRNASPKRISPYADADPALLAILDRKTPKAVPALVEPAAQSPNADADASPMPDEHQDAD